MAANPIDKSAAAAPSPLSGGMRKCDEEPIRIPGSIQRHGFFLLLDPGGTQVLAASQNTEEFLNIPLALVLNSTVEILLDREILGALRSLASSSEKPGLQTYLGSFPVRGKFYSVVTHRVESRRVLEFEVLDRLVSPDMANQVFTNSVSTISSLRGERELCEALAKEIKILTGYNRVLVYRFDEFGHGTVLSEENDGVLPSYLHLRFPASDVPRQARELYVLNTVRIIPDASYVPSPLLGLGQKPIGTLDLSLSLLRSVSPVHLEYMRNMGTMSSMSVSLVCDGKLWGLVSGHHAEPRLVPYLLRSASDLLAKLVCTQLMNIRASSSLMKMVQFHSVQRRILTQMAAENNYLAAIADQMDDLIHITEASGVAFVVDGRSRRFGETPADSDIGRLAEWMDERPELDLFESSCLGKNIGWAEEFREVASGLLVIRISSIRRTYLMWFRPEVVRTIHWAGEMQSSLDQDQKLHPRKSFEVWKELVRGRSDAWTETELESATDFRAAITTISLKRAEEAVHLGEARFLQLTHTLPNPVWTTDDDGHLTFVNQKWLDQGLAAEGRWFEHERILAEDQQRCRDTWRAAIADRAVFELEIRLLSPTNDAERWNLVRMVPYLGVDGRLGGWVGTCTDLTDRRQRETALRMTEKLALTGRMTSVIAHEINNPLEAMTNLLYLLGVRLKEDEVARSYVGLAESELQRISAITKQTLRWSKDSVRKADYGTAGVLFDSVLRLLSGRIRNREVRVTVEGGHDVRLYGVLGQLEQVVANLVSNAVQAVPVGGQIWLDACSQGDTAEIVVRDGGCGMTDETLRNLFQPFYSTKGDLGNGLGLYISHEIVERNGGNLLVTSKLGAGTEIRVRLPSHAPERVGLTPIGAAMDSPA